MTNTYGDEFVLRLENGREIRTDTYDDHPDGASYVRVLDSAGGEAGYWTSDEWGDDPQLVMGAILGCAGTPS